MNFDSFEYTAFPSKVFFGEKSFDNIIKVLMPYQKAFVIAEKRQEPYVNLIKEKVGTEKAFHFTKVIQHVPAELVEEAKKIQQQERTDVLVAIGGGSAIGLAKALALASNHDIIAVPTTYAGSEMTNIWGITTAEGKTTGRDMRVLPEVVIYDPAMTATLPVSLAATSAMNAMAHLMEAVYGHDTNPISYNNSLDGMKKLQQGMNILSEQKKLTPAANRLLQYGSFLAGKGLCEVSMSLHHKLAHVLGGTFGLDHSSVHTVLQAFVLEYQWDALSQEVQNDFCQALEHPYPPSALLALAKNMGAPTSLAEIGFDKINIEKVVAITLSKPYANPKPLQADDLQIMLQRAFQGALIRNS